MLMQALFVGTTLAVTAAARFLIPIQLKEWAKTDTLYTIPPEAKGEVAVVGGKFHHAILAFDGYHLNDPRKRWYDDTYPKWEVLKNNNPEETYDDRWSAIQSFGGYWVGWPWFASIYEYNFEWKEACEKDGKPSYNSRDEKTRYWFANDFDYVMVLDAQDANGLPVHIEYALTVRITNPQKALFEIENWITRIRVAADRVAKDFIATYPYAVLRGEKDNNPNGAIKANFSQPIVDLTRQLLDEDDPESHDPYCHGTKGHYGITIKAADFQKISLSGKAAEDHERAATELYVARQDAEAEVIKSVADATATTNRGTAEANVTALKAAAVAKGAKDRLKAYRRDPELAAVMMETDAQAAPGIGKTVIFAGAAERMLGKALKAFAPANDGEQP